DRGLGPEPVCAQPDADRQGQPLSRLGAGLHAQGVDAGRELDARRLAGAALRRGRQFDRGADPQRQPLHRDAFGRHRHLDGRLTPPEIAAMGTPVPQSLPSPVTLALNRMVAAGALTGDPLQSAAARELDRVADELAEARPALFGRRKAVKGAYLGGAVGRGKTMLMDLFFAAVRVRRKRRVHFDEFMDELHAAITEYRKDNQGDPIAAVTKPIIADTRLLCLDEFQVQDIANAMLLGRLFEKLFAGGVTLVATSNTPPDRLYWNGLNRQLFLPFLELLNAGVEVVPLDGPTDYRRLKFEGEEVYRFGA